MRNRLFILWIGLILPFIFSGCGLNMMVIPDGMLYSDVVHPQWGFNTVAYKDYEIIGPVEGRSFARSALWGLFGGGDAGIIAAYKDALQKSGGDALLDMQVDRQNTIILGTLVYKMTTIVRGTAIKFKK